jgi:hypothetical protein
MAKSLPSESKPIRAELTQEQDTRLTQSLPLSEGKAQQIERRIETLEQRAGSRRKGAEGSET